MDISSLSDQWISLETYLPAKDFRTVDSFDLETKPGYSELRVTIESGREFQDSLKIHVESVGIIFGFIKIGDALADLNNSSLRKSGRIKEIRLYEIKDRFHLVFQMKDGSEYRSFVKKEEVKNLVERCPLMGTYNKYGFYFTKE